MDKVIFTVCRESNKYDKNNLDHLARATHLKPQNLTYPYDWLVVVVIGGSWWFLVVFCGSWRFLMVHGSPLVVLGCSWWFLVVLGLISILLSPDVL